MGLLMYEIYFTQLKTFFLIRSLAKLKPSNRQLDMTVNPGMRQHGEQINISIGSPPGFLLSALMQVRLFSLVLTYHFLCKTLKNIWNKNSRARRWPFPQSLQTCISHHVPIAQFKISTFSHTAAFLDWSQTQRGSPHDCTTIGKYL